MDSNQLLNNKKLNLNGEFLGITSIGVYSAPWFLQVLLLLVIGAIFYYKMVNHSRSLKKDLENIYMQISQSNNIMGSINEYEKKFLGFTITKENIPSYWGGFAIFAITLVFAILNTLYNLFGFGY